MSSCHINLISPIYNLSNLGCFDLLLDADKCKYGIEIQNTMGPALMGGAGMFFGADATPSTLSPQRTPWQSSPHTIEWSPHGASTQKKNDSFACKY